MIFIGHPGLYFSTSKASVLFNGFEYKARNKAEEELLTIESKKGTVSLKPGQVKEKQPEIKKTLEKKPELKKPAIVKPKESIVKLSTKKVVKK